MFVALLTCTISCMVDDNDPALDDQSGDLLGEQRHELENQVTEATCSADCLIGTTLLASGCNQCTGQADQAGQLGHVTCDGQTTYCPQPQPLAVNANCNCDSSGFVCWCAAGVSGGCNVQSFVWTFNGQGSVSHPNGQGAQITLDQNCSGHVFQYGHVTVTDTCGNVEQAYYQLSCPNGGGGMGGF